MGTHAIGVDAHVEVFQDGDGLLPDDEAESC